MIVSKYRQRRSIQADFSGWSAEHIADSGQGQIIEVSRNSCSGGHGENQFVLFTTMQSLLQAGTGKAGGGDDIGRQSRREAEAMQVERKSVADVNGGGSPDFFPQKPAQREAGLGLQMPLPRFAPELSPGQSQSRAAQ